jgi:parallel beta-helix repeat protein
MNGVKIFVAMVVGAALAFGSIFVASTFFGTGPGVVNTPTAYVDTYAGDPESEALLVASEDRRLVEVRAIANAAEWTGASANKPYLLETGILYTLVLTARSSPYTVDDLLRMSPNAFVRQPDGAYVLSENIVVEEGAELSVTEPGLELRLASTAESFVSIVTIGGSLTIAGSADRPVSVSSWDPNNGRVDSDTTDGRSYIHVVGGHAELLNARFSDLGFWSGVTGGVALTGTELAEAPGADDPLEMAGNPVVYGNELIPTGDEVGVVSIAPDLSGYSYVTARIDNVTFADDAFGLFITSADGVTVSNSQVTGSLVDGLVLHRDVRNTVVKDTTVSGSGRDGFSLRRATTGVVFDRVTATGNGRNGISLDGSALASGPNATGTTITIYGNNVVQNSTSSNNARYGIEVLGGDNTTLTGNTLDNNETGIVVSSGASSVLVENNRISGEGAQGISVRNADVDAIVRGNSISDAETGIYVRDAGGVFDDNRVKGATNHAITLIGATGESVISNNIVAGIGLSAFDIGRTDGAELDGNDSDNWISTTPLDVALRQLLQPLTILWLSLGVLVLFTAVSGVGRRPGAIIDPYASHAPLSTFTRGIVVPEREISDGVGA